MGPFLLPACSDFAPTIRTVAAYFLLLLVCSPAPSLGLQVTPNSPCASLCMDDPTQDASDPNLTNTYGADIVCKDSDYSATAVGQKFESCLNCLQNSSAVVSGENDQGWYLYNLRFAFNACIFGTPNATDPITTPCSTEKACEPLQAALEDGMQDLSTIIQYSYCTANGNSFGNFSGTCGQCLQESVNESYFSNFLIVLDAGCVQQPPPGQLIGLNGTVFSQNQVQIISPSNVVPGTTKKHKTLTLGPIIGIAVGGIVLCIVTVATLFVCIRKHINSKRLKQVKSRLDSRFGARTIKTPSKGSYSSPYQLQPPPKKEVQTKAARRSLQFSGHSTREPEDLLAPAPHTYSPRDSGAPILAHPACIPSPRISSSFIPLHSSRAPHPQRPTSISPEVRRSPTPDAPMHVAPSPNNISRPPLRDLSVRRGQIAIPGQISGPMVQVASRYEQESQARMARERLYTAGISGIIGHVQKSGDMEAGVSPESDISEEMWPGRY